MSEQTEQESTRRPPSREIHRHTFKVPHVDLAVEAWWGAQFDASESLRALIRADVARNGVTDTVYRWAANQRSGEGSQPTLQGVADGEHGVTADGSLEPPTKDQ